MMHLRRKFLLPFFTITTLIISIISCSHVSAMADPLDQPISVTLASPNIYLRLSILLCWMSIL